MSGIEINAEQKQEINVKENDAAPEAIATTGQRTQNESAADLHS